MPGLIGMVGDRATQEAMKSAAGSIEHFDDYCSHHTSPFEQVRITQVWRHRKERAGSWQSDAASGVSVFVNGTVIAPGDRPKRLQSNELLDAYLSHELSPEKYDGSFVIAVADPRVRQLSVYNDRLGTLPCYYFSALGCFCFAPEAKAIFSALGAAPEYATDGLVTFLALGYCLADSTLFKSIKFLEPGSSLAIDVPSGTYRSNRHWCMHFDPRPEFQSRRSAEEALHDSIIAGHRSALADPEERYDLLLSGGWDSRGMLAAARELGRLPKRSISWGLRDDVPFSDAHLAAQLAEQYGLDHHFISYDTDTFIENAAEWSYLTELNTDNFGWYGEGTSTLLNEYCGKADFVLVGDECWGFGNHVRNRIEAMAACHMPAPIPQSLADSLGPGLRADCSEIYSTEIDKVLKTCENTAPNDRKDFLYVHGRVARFIFSLGYYKELAVEVRRPFLSISVLDLMQQVPARFRYGKNLYISTLIRFFPELLKVKKRSANSLPQWRRDLREKPGLSRYFADLLGADNLSQTSLAQYLDFQAIDRIAKVFFSTPYKTRPEGLDRSARQGALVQSMKQRLTAYDDIRLALNLRKPTARPFSEYDLLRRIALLALLDRNLSRFSGLPGRAL